MNEFDRERIDFAKFHKTAEKQLLPIFRKALAKSVQQIFSWVENNGVENVPINILIDNMVWRKAYTDSFELMGQKAARKEFYNQRRLDGEAEEKASAIGLLIDVWSQTLREYALNYTYRIEKELNDRTVEIIERALNGAYGLDLDRLGRVRLFLKDAKASLKERSLIISRTETTTIANLGKDIGARSWIDQTGEEGYKVWLGRVVGERPTHVATNDTIIGIDDEYLVGGELAERPGDVRLTAKERVGCRCTQSLMSAVRYRGYVKRGRIQNGKLVGSS